MQICSFQLLPSHMQLAICQYIFSNTHKQLYAFAFVGKRNVVIRFVLHWSWTEVSHVLFSAITYQPSIEVTVKVSLLYPNQNHSSLTCASHTGRPREWIRRRWSLAFLSGQHPAYSCINCGMHDGNIIISIAHYWKKKQICQLQTASCTVISFALPLPWLVEMKQKHKSIPQFGEDLYRYG